MENLCKGLQDKYGDKFLEELEIEAKAKEEAENKLRLNMQNQQVNGQAGEGKLGERFTGNVWEDCRANIQSLVDTVKTPAKTVQGVWRQPLESLLKIYDNDLDSLVSLMTLSTTMVLLNETMKSMENPLSVSVAAIEIGKAIKTEAELEAFCQFEEAQGKAWVRSSMLDGITKRSADSFKLAYFRNRANKEGYPGLSWSFLETEALGAKLVEAVVYGSGYWCMKPVQMDKKKVQCVLVNDWLKKAWETNMDKLVSQAVQYLPMVIPPAHWTTPFDGGYYGASRLHTSFIRFHAPLNNAPVKRYMNMLQRVDLSKVYKALNAMQDTPFRINTFILDIMQEIKARGGDFGGVPRLEPLDKMPELPEGTPKEVLQEHKKKMVALYKADTARQSKALKFLMTIAVAEKFKDQDRIYFPWNIDYRGRCYPIPTALSPQGDDISKSLLLFAEGTPTKENDWKWMAIHGANIAGHDKVPFADRQQ